MRWIRSNSESELRDKLSESLSEYGWRVETEVYSVCKTARVDLLASHPQAGTFGLEIKYMENYSGKKLGEAMKQVSRYRRKEYEDCNVDYWAILPEAEESQAAQTGTGRNVHHSVMDVFQGTINQFGIGFLHRRNEEIIFRHVPKEAISLSRPETTDESDHRGLDRVINERQSTP